MFAVTFLLFSGRFLDRFIKKKSRMKFARNFFEGSYYNFEDAIDTSIEFLNKTLGEKSFGVFVLPNIWKMYLYSLVISIFLSIFYLISSYGNFTLSNIGNAGHEKPAIIFFTPSGIEFLLIYSFVSIIFLVNPILDYVSYVQTRSMLRNLRKTVNTNNISTIINIIQFVVLDTLLTFMLYMIFIYTARTRITAWLLNIELNPKSNPDGFLDSLISIGKEAPKLINSYFSGLGVDGIYGGILISTFISTIFIWYILIAYSFGYTFRGLTKMGNILSHYTNFIIHVYRKPFTVMSYIFSSIFSFLYFMIWMVFL
ncbi:hypothetical protein [Hoeflea sp.]|uniref:hypothetical protein n=1 Tax=Hoeflea sp. TaxID=1940281 RepID=UPI00374A92EB